MRKKVVVSLPQVHLPVLPPVQEACSWFGLSTSPAEGVRRIAKEAGVKPPADNKTLLKLTTSGISERKALDIQSFVEQFYPNLRENGEAISKQGFYKHSNGWQWESLLTGLSSDPWLESGYAAGFVRGRIAREQHLIASVRSSIGAKPGIDGLASCIATALGDEGNIPAPVVDEGIAGLVALLQEEVEYGLPMFIRWLHYARVDFYYHLLCEFSLDLLATLRKAPNFPEIKDRLLNKGPFSDMAPRESESGHDRPFEVLLDRWRVLLGGEKSLSWRELARCMPIPERGMNEGAVTQNPDDMTADNFETQLRRLHEWRNGTVPRPEQLHTFVENLLPDGYDVELAVMQARIALAWGAFLDHEVKLASMHDAMPADELGHFLGFFGSYWAKYKGQAADIAA